jgi:hypothetical protein
MEKFSGRNPRTHLLRKAIATLLIAAPLLASAGTRLIPPPPPRHQNDTTVGGIQQESEWGVFPGQDRWGALRDDEGEELDFNHGTISRKPSANRAPAGLEVTGAQEKTAANDPSWKSSPTDEVRTATKEATTSQGKRPVLKRVTKTEAARQDAETEKFVTEVQDPIARRKGIQEISIIAGDLGFFPKTIFVSRDVPVRLYVTGASKGSLCIMMDSFNVRKQVRANKIEEITFVPNQPGTYRYYCPVNGSEGTMVVKELTTAAVPGEG